MATSILWFRRDLRLADHPALLEAAATGRVVPLFVLDERLLRRSGAARLSFLHAALRSLDDDLRRHGPGLVVRTGNPEQVVPTVARESSAAAVHISADFGPYGAARDRRVERALGSVPLIRTGSPYAVAPGRVRTKSGDPFRVFTPFHRAWLAHGWRAPADSDPAATAWASLPGEEIPTSPVEMNLPDAGERTALAAWHQFEASTYDAARDRPDLDATSRLSTHLRWGGVHPRTLLAGLEPGNPDHDAFSRQLAWRDFYAAVLHAWPRSAHDYFRPQLRDLPYVAGPERRRRLDLWAQGRTGFPIVDAGMRQLLGEGWMHNRVRMIAASFLVKDLQVEWQHGAAHFLEHLVDGDLASNQHNWQWVAGCGTDAAPYFRVFNPISQGQKFDPDGNYIRRWVPELGGLGTPAIHRPWRFGPPDGYPEPIVDHAVERSRALADYALLRQGSTDPSAAATTPNNR